MRQVTATTQVWFLRKSTRILRQRVVRNLECQMGNGGRIIQEEGPIPVFTQELQGLGRDQIRGVFRPPKTGVIGRGARIDASTQGLMGGKFVIVERNPGLVRPKMCRVIVVCDRLAIVAVEAMESLVQWIARASNRPQPPLAECPERLPQAPQGEWQSQFPSRHWLLPLPTFPHPSAIFSDVSMSRMLPTHQDTPRRRADIVPRIMRQEPHPLPGHAVQIGCLDFLLPITSQISITEIIGQNENDIGQSRRRGPEPQQRKRVNENSPSNHSSKRLSHVMQLPKGIQVGMASSS